ncbi:MAG: SCP2 sterol-binding domain-containing protein [Geodermatophilaceae bacterium]|nr:SCP2 sterol-binding domain-containing protein [Geodermatophilaceae bacterium]
MATPDECEQALRELSATLAGSGSGERALQRSVSCSVTDLGVVFAGELRDGRLEDIAAVSAGEPKKSTRADIRLTTTSDDLLKLVDGSLGFATAWSSGRLRVDASIMDLLRLRKML